MILLASAVIKQWYKDGCPNDFTWLDPYNQRLGTYKDFWDSVRMDLDRSGFDHVHKTPYKEVVIDLSLANADFAYTGRI